MTENPFKSELLPPEEKAVELKKLFGDKAIDVIKEIYKFGSANNLREELMYLNFVETEIAYFDINVFIRRMKKLGIEVKFTANLPWVYASEICGKKVKEQKDSEWGYVVGYRNKVFKFVDTKELFNLIRKYNDNRNI